MTSNTGKTTVGKNMKDKLFDYFKNNKELVGLSALLVFVLFFQCLNKGESNTPPPMDAANPEGIDILIPEGHTLIPIEVTNYETLDSLLGPFGVVDLFTSGPGAETNNKKVASLVKILRAPKNLSHFAILVPSQLALNILKHSGPFTASVRNPHTQKGIKFETAPLKKRSRISYN